MRTARLETVSVSSFSGHHQMSLWVVGPQMNKFELVSSDDHQMSLPGGVPGLIFGCGGKSWEQGPVQ